MGRKRSDAALRATAYHEAGHAVVALFLHHRLREVTIVPDPTEGSLGMCRSNPVRMPHDPGGGTIPQRVITWREESAMVCLAGREAQRQHAGRMPRVGHGPDYTIALKLLADITSDEVELRLWWRLLEHRTRKLVRFRWTQIEKLARALLERRTLPGIAVRDLVFDISPEMRAELDATSARMEASRIAARRAKRARQRK
jgi:hypothetical protein